MNGLFKTIIGWFSCVRPTGVYEYVCKQGEHRFKGHKGNKKHSQCFQVKFDSSCEVEHEGHSINKLRGVSDAISHHAHSVRVGWRWKADIGKYEILPYVYQNGKWNREQVVLGTMQSNEWKAVCFGIKDGKYYVEYEGNKYETERTGYFPTTILRGYFGGTSPAPHEMRFWLKYFD